MTKLPAWLDAGEAIALIAFGKVPPRVVREDPEEPPESDLADLPELQETRPWRAPRDLLLAALKARAEGEEWHSPSGEWWTTKEVLDEIARLESETRKDAKALAEELRADIARMGEAEARLRAAEAALRGAAKDGPVVAEGRPANRPNDPRDTIPTKWFDEKRRIDLDGTLKGPRGIEWCDLQFRTVDVLALRLEGRDLATGAAPSAAAPTPAPVARRKGGHPPRDDWSDFDREVTRQLALDGSNMTRRESRRAMKAWAAQNMDPVPDDRTIERRLDRTVHPDAVMPD